MPRGAFRLSCAASVKFCHLRKDVSEWVAETTRIFFEAHYSARIPPANAAEFCWTDDTDLFIDDKKH